MAPALVFYGTIAAFGALAGVALWATFRDREMVWVGFWLVAGFVFSNALHARLPVTELPGPYSLIELMVLVAASVAWGAHRNYGELLAIGILNVISITANVAFAANFPPDRGQVFIWELATNVFFTLECVLAITVGIKDGYRTGRFRRVPRLRRRSIAADAARSEGEAQ